MQQRFYVRTYCHDIGQDLGCARTWSSSAGLVGQLLPRTCSELGRVAKDHRRASATPLALTLPEFRACGGDATKDHKELKREDRKREDFIGTKNNLFLPTPLFSCVLLWLIKNCAHWPRTLFQLGPHHGVTGLAIGVFDGVHLGLRPSCAASMGKSPHSPSSRIRRHHRPGPHASRLTTSNKRSPTCERRARSRSSP